MTHKTLVPWIRQEAEQPGPKASVGGTPALTIKETITVGPEEVVEAAERAYGKLLGVEDSITIRWRSSS